MSFRNAVGDDDNFVWCQRCDFGQLHENGAQKPIICCLKCGFRSCFVHSMPWHEHLTCEEYDKMLKNPDEFPQGIDGCVEPDNTKTLRVEEDEAHAMESRQHELQLEQERQEQRHAEKKGIAKAEQEAEAEKKKSEQGRAKWRGELKKRQKEEQLSMATIQSTTKSCPGCQWPIEKNNGCAHMTCKYTQLSSNCLVVQKLLSRVMRMQRY